MKRGEKKERKQGANSLSRATKKERDKEVKRQASVKTKQKKDEKLSRLIK